MLLGLSFSPLTLKTPCSSEQFGCHALPISHARSFPTKQCVDVEWGGLFLFSANLRLCKDRSQRAQYLNTASQTPITTSYVHRSSRFLVTSLHVMCVASPFCPALVIFASVGHVDKSVTGTRAGRPTETRVAGEWKWKVTLGLVA